MSSHIVQTYLDRNYRIVVWPRIGDTKGPREEKWPQTTYTLADYHEGHRVGLMTGVEVAPGQYLHDVDIDWQPGEMAAAKVIPPTEFVFGRSSKSISHCFYLLSEALPSYRYEDIDRTCLIELRGTKVNGELGLQTMVPPSIWSKDNRTEVLEFVKFEDPTFYENASEWKQRICLAAIGMILAKHLGKNGFGHDARLAWSGFLLRAGVTIDDLVRMGEGISIVTNNLEIQDVRRVVESTASRLTADTLQKIKGGPALAKLIGGKEGKAVIARINEWLGRDSDFIRSADGLIIKDSQSNIKRALQLFEVDVTRNSFSEKLLIKEQDQIKVLEDATVTGLWLRIDREHRFRPSFDFFEKVFKDLAYSNSFHPVKDYLSPLIWDGIPRINTWLIDYGRAQDTPFVQAVSALVLLAAVSRIYEPGCKYDEMLVLEGEQGVNKSSALRALVPSEDWFSDDLPLNVDAKQIIERTLGKWIIEASDLVGGRKADRDHLKSMLSRQVDGPARMAYAHFPVERARQFILIGTTNSNTYLADSTGARRFWPVRIVRFDIVGIRGVRDQMWAEAFQRYQGGESIRLPDHLWADAEGEQELRREEDAWEVLISDAVNELLKVNAAGRKQVTAGRLWDILNVPVVARDRTSAMRLSEIMQRLGFMRTKIREDGKVQAGYVREGCGFPFLEPLP